MHKKTIETLQVSNVFSGGWVYGNNSMDIWEQ